MQVNWHAVFWGLSLQFYLALFILRTQAGSELFDWLGHRFQEFIAYTDEGSKFVFGEAYMMHPYVFKVQINVAVIMMTSSVLPCCYIRRTLKSIAYVNDGSKALPSKAYVKHSYVLMSSN